MEKEILKYYSKFREIYNEENYPEWFKFLKYHNMQFGKKGYNNQEHELGHYAILQSSIPKNPIVVMVGKNNSWFIPKNMEKSLEAVKCLEKNIPDQDWLAKESNFANRLNSQINKISAIDPEAADILVNKRVGMNRFWLQTGDKCPHDKLKEAMDENYKLKSEWFALKKICHKWTEDIIRTINPGLVILFGRRNDNDCAWNLFNKREDGEKFVIKHCPHPVGPNNGENFNKFQEAIKDWKKKI